MARVLSIMAVLALCGCVHLPLLSGFSREPSEPRLLEYSYRAGDHLHAQLAGSGVAGYPMLAASFVDSANMENTNDIGMLLSGQVASRLSQHGYSVTEIQLRSDQLRVDPEGGVFALSRDVEKINTDMPAYSILVGTYTVMGRQIFVNARVLRVSDGVALASSDFSMPHARKEEAGSRSASVQPSVKTSLD
jgi:TolB-like protein